MNNKTGKIALLFSLYIGLHYAAACGFVPNCDCPNVDFPFFDYKALTVAANDPRAESVLTLDISAAQTSLLAEANQPSKEFTFDFIPTALGCDCAFNGYMGPKFPITTLNVFADRAYNDTLPVTASLTSLFKASQFETNIKLDYPVTGYPLDQNPFNVLRLRSFSRPQHPELPIRFTIQAIKSNMDTVSIQTDTLYFQ